MSSDHDIDSDGTVDAGAATAKRSTLAYDEHYEAMWVVGSERKRSTMKKEPYTRYVIASDMRVVYVAVKDIDRSKDTHEKYFHTKLVKTAVAWSVAREMLHVKRNESPQVTSETATKQRTPGHFIEFKTDIPAKPTVRIFVEDDYDADIICKD